MLSRKTNATCFSRFVQYFEDTESSLAEQFNSEYTNDIFNFQSSGILKYFDNGSVRLGVQFQRDKLNHEDYLRPTWSMDETVRQNHGVFIANNFHFDITPLKLFNTAGFDIALRYDKSNTDKEATSLYDLTESHLVEELSPKIGFSLSRKGNIDLILRGSYGKSFRLPSINALFWKGDTRSRGNPGLRPEKSEHSEISGELKSGFSIVQLKGGVTYFHSYISDLIVWSQGSQGEWRPENLEAALLVGHEEFIKLSFFERLIELTYQNTITISRNRATGHVTYNKELIFTPHYITNLTGRLNHKYLYVAYNIRLVDKRYSLANNEKYYDAYRLDDLTLGARLNLNHLWRCSLEYRINNLHDEDYVLITHYPMPGREWEVGFKISYGIEISGKR